MKTSILKLLILLLIPVSFISPLGASIFDANRANVWVINGEESESFAVENWSQSAQLKDGVAQIGTENGMKVPILGIGIENMVIVNNVAQSTPLLNTNMPSLSLVGLGLASKSDYDMNQPSVSITPVGGEFNETIEVTFTLSAPLGTSHTLVYRLNGEAQAEQPLMESEGKNQYTFYLHEKGEYRVEYKLKDDATTKVALFSIGEDNPKKDSDGDGIPDSVEIALGMDPLNKMIPDSDGDGWNDFDEFLRGTGRDSKDSVPQDSDGDGWSDFDETLRGTDPHNGAGCIDKPTARSLYGAEYTVNALSYLGFDETSTPVANIYRASVSSVNAENLYDTQAIANLASQFEVTGRDYNQTICHISKEDLNTTLTAGNIPAMRVPADLSLIARVQESNKDRGNSYVVKAWLHASPNATLQRYLASDAFNTLAEAPFDENDFREGYIAYLASYLVVAKEVQLHQKSSLEVALSELAFKSRYRENSDETKALLLGNPDRALAAEAYVNTLKALSEEENRTTDNLYDDLIAMNLFSKAIEEGLILKDELDSLFYSDSLVLTEELLFKALIDMDETIHYKIALMTLLSLETANSTPSVFDLQMDSDKDTLLNHEEVLPVVHYTHPLKADSDSDGFNDNQDSCPNDAKNQCINESVSFNDGDEDGVVDSIDNCPFDANANQEDSDADGIGDICAKRGIVMVTPRTNIELFRGDSLTFVAKVTEAAIAPTIWFVDGEEVSNHSLTYTYLFNSVGKHAVCVALGEDKAQMSCIEVTVLDRVVNDALSIYSNDIVEGESGEKILLVEVVLDAVASMQMRFSYETIAQTATKDIDYRHISGELVFEVGEQRKYLQIPIVGDIDVEEDETFDVQVGEHRTKRITILNDDSTKPVEPPIASDPAPVALINYSEEPQEDELYVGNSPYLEAGGMDEVNDGVGGINYCKWEDNNSELLVEEFISPAESELYGRCQLNDLPLFTTAGNYIYTLTVTDTGGYSDSNEMNITVLPNSIPTVDIGSDRTITVGTELAITATADDADSDDDNTTLMYQWMYSVKNGYSMMGAGSTLEFKHLFDMVGEYVVRFSAIDSHNARVTKEIDINVTEEINEVGLSQSLFFNMTDGVHGFELWKSDGSAANTAMLKDLVIGGDASPQKFTRVGENILYFTIKDLNNNTLLYKSDGTADNSVLVHNFEQSQIDNLLDSNGVLYFTITNYSVGKIELWKSSGTEQSTQKVTDLFSGYGIENMKLTLIDDTLYFASAVTEGNVELYKYSITTGILSLVKELKEGDGGSYPNHLLNVEGTLYFVANENEIWKSQGTEATTVKVSVVEKADLSVWVENLTYVNARLYFTVYTNNNTISVNALDISSGVVTNDLATYDGWIREVGTMANKFFYVTSSNKIFSILDHTVTEELDLGVNTINDFKIVGDTFYIVHNMGLVATTGIIVKSLSSQESIELIEKSLNDELYFYVYKETADGSFVSVWKTNGSVEGTVELVSEQQAK